MGSGYILAADRLKFIVSNAVSAITTYGITDSARHFDLLSRHRISLLGNVDVPRAAGVTLAFEYTGSLP